MEMMTVKPTASGTPAPYGRACTNCARAKSKCVSTDGSRKCERCHRLNKECQPSATIRRKHAVKKGGISKTAQLEEKLDGLVSLLKSATQPIPHIPEIAQASLNTDAHLAGASTTSPSQSIESGMGFSCGRPHPAMLTPATSTSYQTPTSSVGQVPEPTIKQAQEYLDFYRSQQFKYFPFVVVPLSVSAEELRQQRPFLWTSIMTNSTKSTAQQIILRDELKAVLARKALFEGERSLDLLFGILLYCAWGHYYIHNHSNSKPVLSTLVQVAKALVYDMGLNKPLQNESHMMLNMNIQGCPRPPASTTRTMEERRAVLGCFFISSVYSSYFQRIDALRWTPYMDECLQTLEETKEHSTDALLIQQVKFQLLVERVSHGPWQDGAMDSLDTKGLPAFYLKALQSQLDDLKSKVPLELQNNEMMRWQIYSTELSVHELALSKAFQSSSNSEFQRLECFYACLNATRSWFDLFLSVPPADYVGLPLGIFTQLAHCIVALYRLTVLDDPDWDKELVVKTANLMTILEGVCRNMSEVKEAVGFNKDIPTEEEDVFSQSARKIGSIRSWWETKAAAEEIGPGRARRVEVSAPPVDAQMGDLDMPNIDYSDETWLKELLGSWDYSAETYFSNAN